MAQPMPIPPWYKQFWPWFLIALLASSVAFSLVYLAFAIRLYDGPVDEDYYTHGLAINQQLAKQKQAQQLGLHATLQVDSQTGDVVIDLAGEARPERLHLALIFPTENDRDRELTLEHVHAGRYLTTIDEPLRYRWYLHLQPHAGPEAEWRLTGEAEFPTDAAIPLVPGI